MCTKSKHTFLCGIATCLWVCISISASTTHPTQPFVIFANTVDIRRINLDGTGYRYIVRSLMNVVGLDFDIKTNFIYWSDITAKKIQRVHINKGLDPNNIEDFVSKNLGIPEDLALDWLNRKLFWTDAGRGTIDVIGLDGSGQRALIATGGGKPRAIIVDPNEDKLYWTEWGDGAKITRAKMSDGTAKEVLIHTGLVWPNGLTIDYIERNIFWVDANIDRLEKSNVNGGGREVLIDQTKVYHPYSLTQFRDRLYWTDWQQHTIEHCNKYTGKGRVSITGSMTRPTALHIYHPDRQPGADTNECQVANGGCSDSCVDLIGGFRCLCPAGFELASDGRTCIDVNECSYNRGGCAQVCVNFPGIYNCSCLDGYTLTQDRRTCRDADECRVTRGGCEFQCTNTDSSYYCSCRSGYALSADKHSCQDINECTNNTRLCPETCVNTRGSYTCTCVSGLVYNPVKNTCDDVNECVTSLNSCQQRCLNTRGAFHCACSTGFVLLDDGITCRDVNECSQSEHSCQQRCTNTDGSYTCSCNSGYRLAADGSSCKMVRCGIPEGVKGIGVTCDGTADQYIYGKRCTLTCVKGFLIGLNNIACQSSGIWSIIRAQCVNQAPGSNSPPTSILVSSSSVPENIAIGSIIGKLTTVDRNSQQDFTYTMVDGAGGLFGVDNSLRALVVAGDLDYETKSRHVIRLMSTDSGIPPLSCVQNFTIRVMDINEPPSPPVLSSSSVYENASIGCVLGRLTSSDVDTGTNLTFSLLTDAGGRFRVDKKNLEVNFPLDFEQQSSHVITVKVHDNGSPRLSATSVLNITVLDSNDPPKRLVFHGGWIPEFSNDPNGTQNGTVIGNLSTVDEDLNDSHSYEILVPDSEFMINSSSLVVSHARSLDYESRNVWVLRIRSIDRAGAMITSSIRIHLRDINERPTLILLSAITFLEHAPLGTLIGTFSSRDPDLRDNYTFSLISNPESVVLLNGSVLVVGKDVDYETTRKPFQIRIQVTDRGGLSYEQDFNITVIDKNEPPTSITLTSQTSCSSGSRICVAENKLPGYPVADIVVQDPDRGDVANCEVVSGDAFGVKKYILVVKGKINYEGLDSPHVIALRLRCRDKGGLGIENTFNISILDSNDPPSRVFLSHQIVSSNAPVGSLVGSFTVQDEDKADSHFCHLLTVDSPFRIQGLQLRTKKLLTNSTSSRQPVRVWCNDGLAIAFPQTFYVEVRNINMSARLNITMDSTEIDENKPAGSVVGQVLAKTYDPTETLVFQLDVDSNGTFGLLSGHRVNSRKLVTTRPLDYEDRRQYTVVVRVQGSRGRTNFELFTIKVLDVYEAPDYLVLHHNSVSENVVNALVGLVTLRDPQMSQLTFRLITDHAFKFQPTAITYTRKLVTRTPLDYETSRQHNITINVQDTRQVSAAVNQTFTINVININESPTAINLTNTHILENSPTGTLIGYINVTDPDEPLVPQSFACGLRNDASGRFLVSGLVLRVADSRLLDYEGRGGPYCLIDIECQDQDGDTVQQQFTIHIMNVDEPPTEILSLTGKFEVPENRNPGFLVAQLRTVDQDEGDSFTYTLGDFNSSLVPFSIQGNRLITMATLNYESHASYLLNITSMDRARANVTQLVQVQVLDVNDPPSGIVLPLNTAVTENSKIGSLVAELTTLDEDAGQTHTYVIHSQTPSGALAIRNTDILYIADSSQLNFESIQTIQLSLATTDHGVHTQLSKVVTIEIPILDTNESPYDIEVTPRSVKENPAIGSVVGRITVMDPDTFPQYFTCLLTNDARGRFRIRQNASKIELLTTGNGLGLDFERQNKHNVSIKCTDGGGFWYQKKFRIDVLDANDIPFNVIFTDALGDTTMNPNPPNATGDVHVNTIPVATVNETAKAGITIVAYVRVVDQDNLHSSQRHTCALISEDDAQLFVVIDAHTPHTSTGQRRHKRSYAQIPTEFMIQPGTNSIIVRSSLNHEVNSNFTLFLKCTDTGVPPLSTVALLRVYVLDVPEAPTNIMMSSLSIRENSPEGTVLGIVSITDPDSTPTAYSFELTSRGVPFRLVGSHVVLSRIPIDHEETPVITIQIRVREVFSELQFTKNFNVNVTDVNEAPSKVTLDGKTVVNVLESVANGYVIGTFVVEDQDKYDKSFTITINGGKNSSNFAIRENKLIVAAQLNAWIIDRYELEVRATDRGGLSTINVLTIVVQEVDLCLLPNRTYCSPHAMCAREGPGRAKCTCQLGFTGDGRTCADINLCASNPCHPVNSIGECQDGFGGWRNYSCSCKPGWSPPDCNVEINECLSNPCNANGTYRCENLLNGFQCHCRTGFTGLFCERNINYCRQESCLHGGACVDKVNGFVCICKDPFIGVNCDTDDSVCRENSNICPHNGTCISYPENSTKYSCRCNPPWSSDCRMGCAPGYGGSECKLCEYPWTGENCEQDWRNCRPNSCLNGGTCYPLKNKDFACVCPVKYFSKRCEKIVNSTKSSGSPNKGHHFGPATYGLIASVLFLLVVLIVTFLVCRWKRHQKYISNSGRIEFNPKSSKEVSPPFEEMMEQREYEFMNPAFTPTQMKHADIRLNASRIECDEGGNIEFVHRATVIRTSSTTVAKSFDNPVYESAEAVLRKEEAKVVFNPLFAADNSSVDEARGSVLLWRDDRLSKC